MKKELANENLTPIKIKFGDVFTGRERDDNKYLIVNVGQGKTCDAIGIQLKDGQEALGIGGTTGREDIGEIVDHWDLERITKAVMRYFNHSKSKGEMYDLLKEYSHQKPRVLEP